MKRHPFARLCLGFALFGLMLTGCARTPATGQAALRVAVIPVLDSLPLHVAQQMGLFEKHGVRWQMAELGKVDQGGGGTVAKYMANRGIATIDAGVPVLSMHAPWEITSKLDAYHLYKAVFAVYCG